jgi:hypothetical protein
MVDRKGKVQVLFSLVDLAYSLDVADILKYLADMKTLDGLPDPQPPALAEATKTSLDLQWLNCLPYPPGIVQAVELQYALMNVAATTLARSSSDNHTTEGESNRGDAAAPTPHLWSLLVSRTYSKSQIGMYKWTHIAPGSNFVVRIRYRTSGTNWSDYSEPSAVYSTLPDRPRQPPPPTCLAVTSFAIQIMWGKGPANTLPSADAASTKRTVGDNGSPITEYLLMGKSVGDEFVELYRGPNQSYLLLGLYPEFAYSFQVAAINAVGTSDYSALVTVQTPARPTRASSMARSIAVATAAGIDLDQLCDFSRALFATAEEADREVAAVSGFTEAQIAIARQCKDAWREYWDGTTEQTFYFNSILSVRQLEVPPVLRSGAGQPNVGPAGSSRHPSTTGMARSTSTDSTAAAVSTGSTRSPARRRSNPQAATTPVPSPTRPMNGAVTSVIDPNSPEMQFRKKRFRLLLALRRQRQNFAKSSDVVHLELSRSSMLSDCYSRFADMSAQDFKRRLRVSFLGERGLDCGGLSKEAYLLLSKQAAYYGGPKYHKWLRSVTSTVLVPSAPKQKEVPPMSAEEAADRNGRPPALKAPVPEPAVNTSAAEVKYVEEQVEGYFLTAVNEQSAAPSVSAASASTSHTKIDPQAEECYNSIIELDTTQHISSADYFRFLGRFLAKALFDRQLVDFPLSPLLLRHLLGEFRESTTRVRTHADAFNEAVALAESAKATGNAAEDTEFDLVGVTTKAAVSKHALTLAQLEETKAAVSKHALTLAQLEELKYMDQEAYKSLKWMSENCITDVIYETFSVTDGKKEFPLCADGEKTSVTEANKMEYIKLMIQWRISYSVLHNLVPFVTAFHEVVPLDLLLKSELTPTELNAMLNGKSEVNVEELRAFCIYQGEEGGFNDTHDTVIWFWQAVRSFTQAERRNLLLFFTGSGKSIRVCLCICSIVRFHTVTQIALRKQGLCSVRCVNVR